MKEIDMAFEIRLDPSTKSSICMKFYRNVKNTAELREALMKGRLNCCIVNPSLIIDPFQVVIAANKALTAENFTTKSIYTEILFNLSISKNISQSLQKFGINDEDKNLLVVVISNAEKENQIEDVFNEIKGDLVDISFLNDVNDTKLIRKTYKISDEEAKHNKLIDSIVSRISTKDFVSI